VDSCFIILYLVVMILCHVLSSTVVEWYSILFFIKSEFVFTFYSFANFHVKILGVVIRVQVVTNYVDIVWTLNLQVSCLYLLPIAVVRVAQTDNTGSRLQKSSVDKG